MQIRANPRVSFDDLEVGASRRYSVSIRLVQLGSAVAKQNDLLSASRPIMQRHVKITSYWLPPFFGPSGTKKISSVPSAGWTRG